MIVQVMVIAIMVLAALALVVAPLVRKPATDVVLHDDSARDHAIASYRASLRAGTVCEKCLRDNPEGSKFCADCGAKL